MPLTLLVDLDDTLLNTNLESFIPAYFQALTQCLEPRVLPTVMLHALIRGMSLMSENNDPTRTLQAVFDAHFYPSIGIPKEELAGELEKFYDEVFPTLQIHTRRKPEATPLMEWALDRGYRVAIATDPFFPRSVTYQRLCWAGLEPERFDLFSTFEDFHFSKSHPAYYAEVLGRLGWPDGPVLMVGNDAQRDVISASRMGLKTYFVDGESGSSPGVEAGRGSLAELRPWLESIEVSALEPVYRSSEAIPAILRSTLAVLDTLTHGLTDSQWRHEPQPADWAINEIVCHLRDTELEIHQLQLDLMLEKPDAFIPRPDTSVWANEREYLHVDGAHALREFSAARLANLRKLEPLGHEVWARRARHAIFGPTNFLEVMGFMADHDQMHVQQALKTLKKLQIL